MLKMDGAVPLVNHRLRNGVLIPNLGCKYFNNGTIINKHVYEAGYLAYMVYTLQ